MARAVHRGDVAAELFDMAYEGLVLVRGIGVEDGTNLLETHPGDATFHQCMNRLSVRLMDFSTAEVQARLMVEADSSDPSVLPGAGARLWSHGEYRHKAVLMLHGYTHTPEQVSALCERFFAAGYNVLAPRAPQHGLVTQGAYSRITAVGLREHAAAAWRVASGLGAEVGVAGISGGAVLATWLATQAGLDIRKLLVLAPFYGPHPRRAAPAVATAMRVLFGPGVLPDRATDRGYSYTALAQYLKVSAVIPKTPVSTRLLHVAVALSAADDSVHPRTAFTLPAGIAATAGASFGSYLIPASASLGHDIVSPEALGDHTQRIHSRYLELFAGVR